MDILAAAFAYLTCVAGIVGAAAVALFVVFSAPEQPAATAHVVPTHLAATHLAVTHLAATHAPPAHNVVVAAKPGKAATDLNQIATVSDRAKLGSTQQQVDNTASHAVRRSGRRTAAANRSTARSRTAMAPDFRPGTRLSANPLDRSADEARAKRWAYQDSGFESRFLGYAD